MKPPKLRNLTEEQEEYQAHIQDLRYGVKHKNKYETVNKYTSKEKLDMFNVIDKNFNIWCNKDDPIQKTLDEKVMAPSIKNFDQNKRKF